MSDNYRPEAVDFKDRLPARVWLPANIGRTQKRTTTWFEKGVNSPSRERANYGIEVGEWVRQMVLQTTEASPDPILITPENGLHRKSDLTGLEADQNTVHLGGTIIEHTTLDGGYESGVKAGWNFTLFNTLKNQIHSISETIIGVGAWDAGSGLYPAAYSNASTRYQANGNVSTIANAIYAVQGNTSILWSSPIIYGASTNLVQFDSVNTILNASGTTLIAVAGYAGGAGEVFQMNASSSSAFWGPLTAEYFPTHADEAAAIAAGLSQYAIYKTASGELRYKL